MIQQSYSLHTDFAWLLINPQAEAERSSLNTPCPQVLLASSYPALPRLQTKAGGGPSSASRVYFLGKTLFLWPFCLNASYCPHQPPCTQAFPPARSLPTPCCVDVFPEILWHFWLLSTLSQISIGLRRGSRIVIRAKGRQALTAFQSPLPRASIFPLHCE